MKEKKKNQSIYGIILMIICSLCLCLGQLVWKYYSGMIALLMGFLIYGIGALSMIAAYKFGKLSVLQPINSVSYIFSSAIGVYVFHERIGIEKILGIVCIMLGVLILSRDGENN